MLQCWRSFVSLTRARGDSATKQVATGGPETLAIQDFAMQVAMIELGVRPKAEVFHGNLETLRDMTDVRDSARVMVDLAEKSAPGLVYNVCSSRAIKVPLLAMALPPASRALQFMHCAHAPPSWRCVCAVGSS